MIAELNNTFGERLPELLPGSTLRYEHEKRLHVSPFMGLDQRYRYAFSEPDETVYARIEVHQDGRMPLQAVLAGRRRELTNREVARFLVRYPLMPRAGHGAHPLERREALAQARAVPPQAAVRAREGVGAAGDDRRPRPASRSAEPAVPALGRVAMSVLERVLPGIQGGTLVLRLPDGSERRYGSGAETFMRIDDWNLLDRIARSPKLALGESFQAGEWDSRRSRPAARAAPAQRRRGRRAPSAGWRRFAEARPRLNRRTGLLAARRNIEAHYDLGNDLFALFLDETMTYSCAIFEDHDETLADAQRRKLRRVCERLELGPDDHVLEIGCGWGSFALTAAGEFGARVTAVTISPAQAQLARERVADAGLADRIEVVERDFRELDGTFTKVASIEMLEAVGEKLWAPFFATCDRLLAPGGRACIQTILVADERLATYRASPDWIERHIFPGCLIPSRAAIRDALEPTSLARRRRHGDRRRLRARRCGAGASGSTRSLGEVRALGYDERFVRTWDFYLASCEALFRTGHLRDAQLVLAR